MSCSGGTGRSLVPIPSSLLVAKSETRAGRTTLESAREIWQRVLGELQIEVSKANYTTWLKNSHGIDCQQNLFVVGVPNTFVAEWLTKRLHSLVRKTTAQVVGRDVDVQFVVHDVAHPRGVQRPQAQDADGGTSVRARPQAPSLRYTFDNFIVGDCNRLAYAAALEVAESPGTTYNPLCIYSGTGQGKTHLLYAIAERASQRGLQVTYTSAEHFTNAFVLAVRQKHVDEFRSRFSTLDLLLFDDVQFIVDKKQTQQSFFHVFNELYSNNRQIVVTSDHPPHELDMLNHRLRSRLESGLTTPIQPPDYEARLAILQSKADQAALAPSEEVLQFLARSISGNVRQLQGVLVYLGAQAKLAGEELSLETASRFLQKHSGRRDKELIVQAVSKHFGLLPEQLRARKRDKTTALARHLTMYLMRQDLGYSFSEVGKELGNRDHATVVHGCQKIASEAAREETLSRHLTEIRDRIARARLSTQNQ